jgi:hypothetical protein
MGCARNRQELESAPSGSEEEEVRRHQAALDGIDRQSQLLEHSEAEEHGITGLTEENSARGGVAVDRDHYITARPLQTTITGDRASVTLRFRLPDANAPAVRDLMHDWDEGRLNRLAAHDRRRITARLEELHAQGALPTIEGDETMELVREGDGWKVFLN